jgi:hypothetical protein
MLTVHIEVAVLNCTVNWTAEVALPNDQVSVAGPVVMMVRSEWLGGEKGKRSYAKE